jgi:hypothetical protein
MAHLSIRSTAVAFLLCAGFFTSAVTYGADAAAPIAPGKLSFNRDVQPILSENCYFCHGTDKNQRKAGLRLDSFEEATRDRKGTRAIVPGKSGDSEIIKRMLSTDPDEVMPPKDSHREVTKAQIETLRKWIDQGAEYEAHWSFIPPKRPEVPVVKQTDWVRNPIDAFVLARLEKEGLKPSPQATKEKLIRRVTLDLTGLPPTPEEVDAFVADYASDAYEKLVDRLLASPKYGERMVAEWLDAARYADTNGYQGDPTRTNWPWRDWVVRAMNANMPFDRFVTEQLAGDLLPSPTPSQRLATAFNRNHTFNGEGGRIPEETRVENVMDRTETFGSVFLGLTVGCTRCHDHKYDPITQQEYYELYAYFNNCSETGKFDYVPGTGNVRPVMAYTTPEQDKRLAELVAASKAAEARLNAAVPQIDAEQASWETQAASAGPTYWTLAIPDTATAKSGATLKTLTDGSLLASGALATTDTYELTLKTEALGLTGLRLDVLGDDSLPNGGPGRATNGNFVLSGIEGEVVSATDPKKSTPLAFRAGSATADYSQPKQNVGGAIDADPKTGWAVMGAPTKNLSAQFAFTAPVGFPGGSIIKLRLKQDYAAANPGSAPGQHQIGRFRVSLTASPILPPAVSKALAVAPDKRDDKQKQQVRDYYRGVVSPTFKSLEDARATAKKAEIDYDNGFVKVMVMDDDRPREAHLLYRGGYDKPAGPKLAPAVPAVLNKLSPDLPKNRLGLAKWLTSPQNPLLARVTVNRYWQMFFGIGLVKTSDDFGLQGEKPSHPELLDWLAVQFRDPSTSSGQGVPARSESKWDVKAIHRLIVTSSTYRQNSKVSPDLVERDPQNRLLARGPRYRLSSFAIRDQALAVSGLMVDRMGGAPVKPYQPPGVWEEMSLDQIKYTQDHGEALYRRSLYTFWRRTVSPTTFFDVPQRAVCSVRQVRTNTPLHALALLNDVTYIEASRVLAEKLLSEKSKTDDQRLERLFRVATSRDILPSERQVLGAALARLRQQFSSDKDAAAKLISVGEKPRNPQLDATELAAWTTVVSTVMNLDETITQE